jgi:uncharacterized protein (UPF0335 family)
MSGTKSRHHDQTQSVTGKGGRSILDVLGTILTKVSSIEEDVKTLKEDVKTLKEDVKTLTHRVDRIEKYLGIGSVDHRNVVERTDLIQQ